MSVLLLGVCLGFLPHNFYPARIFMGDTGSMTLGLLLAAQRLFQLADQRALMAAVSHELRSPLGRARVMIEMMREGSAGPSVHDDLQAEIDRLNPIMAKALQMLKADFGREVLVIDVCDTEYTGPGERVGAHEYEAWIAFSDQRAHYVYPRVMGGYAF